MKLAPDHNRTVYIWKNLAWVVVLHGVALGLGPVMFSWPAWHFGALSAMLFGYSMGIFHHMLLSHRTFRAKRWVECLGTLFGTLAWRGPFGGPVRYVAIHRVHHFYSDTELDPHSPIHGVAHAWLGWFWRMPYGFTRAEIYKRYAGGIARDPWHLFLDRNVNLLQLAWGTLCFLVGALAPAIAHGAPFDWVNGIRFVVFGVFVKTLIVVYVGNAVDVINHRVGYRNFETDDRSTNSLLMAAFHLGGAISWHNNHHAYPGYFKVAKKWWEFDVYYLFLKGLERLSLVSEIKSLDATDASAKARPAAA